MSLRADNTPFTLAKFTTNLHVLHRAFLTDKMKDNQFLLQNGFHSEMFYQNFFYLKKSVHCYLPSSLLVYGLYAHENVDNYEGPLTVKCIFIIYDY